MYSSCVQQAKLKLALTSLCNITKAKTSALISISYQGKEEVMRVSVMLQGGVVHGAVLSGGSALG